MRRHTHDLQQHRGHQENIQNGKPNGSQEEETPKNLTTNKQDGLLTSAAEVTDTWFYFLQEKFRETDVEQDRPDMEPLPTPQDGGLTEKEIQEGLSKMPSGKATGLDSIPASTYKDSKIYNKILVELLQKI